MKKPTRNSTKKFDRKESLGDKTADEVQKERRETEKKVKEAEEALLSMEVEKVDIQIAESPAMVPTFISP